MTGTHLLTPMGNVYCRSQIFKRRMTLRIDAKKVLRAKALKHNALASYEFLLEGWDVQLTRLDNTFIPIIE